ncbi:DUF3261 domain-containing protein [Pseudoalteromonas ulvae]|uniref:DUF3261 domain-containing protein n=1 Tax=Pseudoalteromonas ulvae TaxID=107327 RepID=A0A244CLL6_PSEDV|nr:DUF3261 domain-containing protein [Pseudoalteromonas ulvae]OUL56475.1 hypothetical protein B1199_17590 [Pseudoalteromonas ulvae]
MSKQLIRLTFIVLLGALLGACSSLTTSQHQVILSSGVALTLTAPPEGLVGQTISQLLEIDYQGEQHSLLAQVQFQPNGLNLVATSVQGLPVFELTYIAGEGINAQRYVPVAEFDFEYIVADIQLALWPMSSLEQSLMQGEMHMVSDGFALHANGDMSVRVHKTDSITVIQHFTRHYQLTITTLE